jgi:hypothetical protein
MHQHTGIKITNMKITKYDKRKSLCYTRRDRRTDITGLTISSSNCNRKAPTVGKCFRLDEITCRNSCISLSHSWLPRTCPIFAVSLSDLPHKTRKKHTSFRFWYFTDGKLTGMCGRSSVESCDPVQTQSMQTLRILLSGADVSRQVQCSFLQNVRAGFRQWRALHFRCKDNYNITRL